MVISEYCTAIMLLSDIWISNSQYQKVLFSVSTAHNLDHL